MVVRKNVAEALGRQGLHGAVDDGVEGEEHAHTTLSRRPARAQHSYRVPAAPAH